MLTPPPFGGFHTPFARIPLRGRCFFRIGRRRVLRMLRRGSSGGSDMSGIFFNTIATFVRCVSLIVVLGA